MSVMRPADVATRVVAWHNRHPLARRIGREQVSGIGIVVLPFALPETEPGAPRRPQALTPLFGDDWMFHAAARHLGAWSRRHGVYPLPGCEHWPLRQIDAELALAHAADARGLTGRTARHLMTALVDADGRRTRVLLSPQGDPRRAPVFGQRLFSLPHAAGLATAGSGVGAALAAAVVLHLLSPTVPPPAAASTALPSAPAHPVPAGHTEGQTADAASAKAADHPSTETAALPASAPDSPTQTTVVGASGSGLAKAPPAVVQGSAASDVAPDAAPLPSTVLATLPAPTPPIDTEAVLRRPDDAAPPLVQLRPVMTAEQRDTARRESQALRATTTTPTDTTAAVPTGPVFAIATRPSRSRDDALALQAVLQGLKTQSITAIPTRLDLMAAQGRWRVVWWPHPRQEDAQALLVEARARGLPVALIRF